MSANSILTYETQLERKIRTVRERWTAEKTEEVMQRSPLQFVRFCPVCGKEENQTQPAGMPCCPACQEIYDRDVGTWLWYSVEGLVPRAIQVLEETPLEERIYFIRAKESGRVKIGYSTDVGRRLQALQTASPEPLELLCTVRGDHLLEMELHRWFADLRGNGEWFDPAPELMELIDDLVSAKMTSL